MDLIGPFDPCSNGHLYDLTVTCMVAGYAFCVSLKTRSAVEEVQAYIDEVYATFRESVKNQSENGNELKN